MEENWLHIALISKATMWAKLINRMVNYSSHQNLVIIAVYKKNLKSHVTE